MKALGRLADAQESNIWLLTLGRGNLTASFSELPYTVRHLGVVNSDHVLATCYSAADVFVAPSLADNLPQTMLEATSCGTPSVAFDTCGAPEVVRHMETGYLAAERDSDDLAKGIRVLLGDSTLNRKMGGRCREVALEEFTLSLQAERYLDLYSRLIEDRATASARPR